MGIGAILFLIGGIFNIILCILVINHYRLHPEKEGAVISILVPFILGIIFIMGAITGYNGLAILFLIISGIIFRIYTAKKYPELKKHREMPEMYKKYPYSTIWRIMRISRYIMLGCAIFLTLFILIVVFFNITF